MRSIPVIIAACLLLALNVAAQNNRRSVEWITDKQSVNGPSINTVLKDSSGALWLGTVDGLIRWNGKEMDQFHHEVNNPTTLPHNVINKIAEKSSKELFVATSGGFCIFNTVDHTCKNYLGETYNKENANQRTVNDFIALNDSIVIISFMYSGLHRLNIKTWQSQYLDKRKIPGELSHFKKLLITAKGDIVCAAMGQLLLLDEHLNIKKTWFNVPQQAGTVPFDNQFLTVINDQKNKDILWVGTWGGGLKQLNMKTGKWISYYFEDKNLPQNLHNIAVDVFYTDDSTITVSNTINFYDFNIPNKQFIPSVWNNVHSPQGALIRHITVMSSGEQWVFNDHEFGHVSIRSPEFELFPWNNEIKTFSFVKGSASERLEAFTWYDKRSFLQYNILNGKTVEKVPLSRLDKNFSEIYNAVNFNKRFIVAATKSGIFNYDRKEKSIELVAFINDTKKIPVPYIIDISPINTQGDYILTDIQSGLWRCHFELKGHKIVLTSLIKLKLPRIGFIQQMQSGRIYIAGEDLSYYDDEVSAFKKVCRLPGAWQYATINQMLEDENHKLWITADQLGVLRINLRQPEEIEFLQQGKNTPSTFFDAIEDHAGGIWTISYYGLHRISSVMKIYNYQQRELKNITPQSMFLHLGMESWIFTGKEFIRLTSQPVENILSPCTIEFREMLVNGQSAGNKLKEETLTLNHSDNIFSLKLSSIDLYHPERIFYRYQTKGIDPKTLDIGNNNYISYSNLGPGSYYLKVEAYDPETGRTRATKTLKIVVVPAWYQQFAVKITGLLILVLIATGVGLYINKRKYRLRLNELQKQKELEVMRQSISKDIHDELGSSITRITRSTELLLRQMDDRQAMETQLTRLGNLSKNLGKSLSEIVWAVNPKQDKLENFLLYARQYVQELGEENDIDITLRLPTSGLDMLLLPKAQRNLFLLVKEACNNVVKYAKASAIDLRIDTSIKKDTFSISISDNGRGFDLLQIRPFSNGLTNMRNRCEELGLSFDIETSPGNGTTVKAFGSLKELEQKSY